MTTARDIITGALAFGLNRLSPGETLEDDLAQRCLQALNHIADSWNGSGDFLFREILTTSGALSSATATLGVDWPTLSPGAKILGATVAYSATMDVQMNEITMAQYADIGIKSISTIPRDYAFDGLATLYFYPVPNGQTVTLRTRQNVSDFADLDTSYSMPNGYKSALSDILAETLAPSILGGTPAEVARKAAAARNRLAAGATIPAIIGGNTSRANIYSGFR